MAPLHGAPRVEEAKIALCLCLQILPMVFLCACCNPAKCRGDSHCHADSKYGESQRHVELLGGVAVAVAHGVPHVGEAEAQADEEEDEPEAEKDPGKSDEGGENGCPGSGLGEWKGRRGGGGG